MPELVGCLSDTHAHTSRERVLSPAASCTAALIFHTPTFKEEGGGLRERAGEGPWKSIAQRGFSMAQKNMLSICTHHDNAWSFTCSPILRSFSTYMLRIDCSALVDLCDTKLYIHPAWHGNIEYFCDFLFFCKWIFWSECFLEVVYVHCCLLITCSRLIFNLFYSCIDLGPFIFDTKTSALFILS